MNEEQVLACYKVLRDVKWKKSFIPYMRLWRTLLKYRLLTLYFPTLPDLEFITIEKAYMNPSRSFIIRIPALVYAIITDLGKTNFNPLSFCAKMAQCLTVEDDSVDKLLDLLNVKEESLYRFGRHRGLCRMD